MSIRPKVSVVIAAANAAGTLPRALDAIERQDYTGPIETIVAAADAPTAEAASRDGVTVVENPGVKTPSGLNLAIGRSTGEIVVRVDAHSTLPDGYVSRVVDVLHETGAEVVGGMQTPAGETFWERAIGGAMGSPFGAGDARYRIGGRPGPVDTVYLGAFRRSTFDRLGGFDESFVRHQDYELNHRVRATGGTVWFDPGLEVEYRPRSSLTALAGQYFQYGRWKRRFSRVHPGSLRPRQLAPPLLVVGLAGSLFGSLRWPLLLLAPLAYLAGLVVAGFTIVPRAGVAALGSVAALAVMHLSWGAGFLIGQRSDR